MSSLMDYSVENLIEEVEKRPALYQKDLKEYSDMNYKKILWEEICEEIIPVWNQLDSIEKREQGNEIQKKWNNLRTCFRREINKQKSGKANKRRRKYIYFQQLSFLLPSIEFEPNEGKAEIAEDHNYIEYSPSRTFTPKRRKVVHLEPKSKDMNETLLTALEKCESRDEDTNFVLSIVPSLRELSREENLDAKIQILKIFKQIRMNRAAQDSTSSSADIQ